MKRMPKVLLVDDDANLRKTLSDILKLKGYAVSAAVNGMAAIAEAQRAVVDVALIDLMLPDMSGIAVMERIKKVSSRTEAIILTGHASLETAIEATSKGAFSYLLKPYEVENLLLHVRLAIDRRQAQEEIRRLASFPRLDPQPVIEIAPSGEVTYANPAADKRFPDLRLLDEQHPLLNGLEDVCVSLRQGKQKEIVREAVIGASCYEEHLYYVPESELIRLTVLNVTERKRIEKELRASEQQFMQFFMGVPIALGVVNKDGIITHFNNRFTQVFGYTTDDVPTINDWWQRAYPDESYRQRVMDSWGVAAAKAARDGTDIELSGYKVTTKSGAERITEIGGFIFGGNLLATFVDITERKLMEIQLRDSEEKFKAIFDNATDGISLADMEDKKLLLGNTAFCRMLGYAPEEIANLHVTDLHPANELPFVIREFEKQSRGEKIVAENIPVKRKDGSLFYADITTARMNIGDKTYLASFFMDITERKQAEANMRIAATAFEAREGITVTDLDGTILRVNSTFTDITGYTAEEAIGMNPRILKSGRQNADFYATMWESINKTGAWEGEIWNRRKSGEVYPEYICITAVKDKYGKITNYVGEFNDITVSKKASDEIKNLAFYDPLTGLPNRRLLMDRLKQALASNARSDRGGALLFIDLDNFKDINDTLGHDIGDLLLQQTAQRLESCMRAGDTVSRLGGDEFVVMLEDLSEQAIEAAIQAEITGEKILTKLGQPYQLDAHEYHCTPSIGATLFSNHNQSGEELLKRADIAMYQAKKSGRNALIFFDPKMQDVISARTDLERELRRALEKQQFHLYYQVQVDSSHRPLGAEALIRWIHPERGLISPAQFIPLAEETGLILPIGLWVLETACTNLKAWEQNAFTRELVLSVNVSAKQFLQTDFVAQVQSTMQRHAINPMRLKLEITESMLIDNIADTITTMNALKEIGVMFSLDDFGTGYSSLQYLKRLPLDQLKIDQSFVRDLATDNNDKAIVRTIIAMAHSLNLDVIAEGVETKEQRQFLMDNGCAHFQGYLFGKPVPIEQFEALLKSG